MCFDFPMSRPKMLRVRHHFGSLDKVLADSGPQVNPQFDGCHAGFTDRRHYRIKTQHPGKYSFPCADHLFCAVYGLSQGAIVLQKTAAFNAVVDEAAPSPLRPCQRAGHVAMVAAAGRRGFSAS
jgi:hypothetical protein